MKKNKNNTNDKKRLILILAPVLLASAILFFALFSSENKAVQEEIPQSSYTELLIPDSQEEESIASKKESYIKEKNEKRRLQIEEENEVYREEDFFKYLSEGEEEDEEKIKREINNVSIEELYAEDMGASSTSSPKYNKNTISRSSIQEKKIEKHPVSTKQKITSISQNPKPTVKEESNIEKMYREATSTSGLQQTENQQEEQVPIDGRRRRRRSTSTSSENKLIHACIHGDQTISTGATVRMRLLEDLLLNDKRISKNTLFYGIATIGKERLNINVSSIKFNNEIIKTTFSIYDNDALIGLNLPDNIKQAMSQKAKQNVINNINIPSSGGIIGDAISGTANAVKNVIQNQESQMKVTLKSNYKIFILQN